VKAVVIPYSNEILIESKTKIEVHKGYDTVSRTEGRDGVKLVLASSCTGIIDRWAEANKIFGVYPVISPVDVFTEDGFIVLPVFLQGKFKTMKLPKELSRLVEWCKKAEGYRVREDGCRWLFRDCPAFRLILTELFDDFWFFFGDKPSFDPKKEIVSEIYEEEQNKDSPVVVLAKEKRKPVNDDMIWEPSPLFDFRWSG
jgi:hypothetical protein